MKKVLFLLLFLTIMGTAKVVSQVTIGVVEQPDQWSLLDLKQTSSGTAGKALHFPRLTPADRDALTASEKSLTKGLVIYNTTTNCLEYWNLQKWVSLCAGQASISFDHPNGSDAGDITQPAFPAAGGLKGPFIPHEEPKCNGQDPAYTFLITSGAEFTHINLQNSTTGQFTILMGANETATSRNAILRVINNCTGEYKEFVFTQLGDDGNCGTTTSIPSILSENTLNLCPGGSVYLYLAGRPTTGTYIWTLGEVEKGRGANFTATIPGIYKVYADKLGCTTVAPQSVTVTSGSTAAPAPVSIIVANNGYVCADGGETQLFASATGPGNIVWYKNGAKQTGPGMTGPNIGAGVGNWFAVMENGNCSSTPSNTVTVARDPNAGLAIQTPVFTINGNTAGTTVSLCSGGVLILDVINPQIGAIYTWLMNNTEKGSGTHYEMSMAGVTSNFVLQCRAEGGGCSSAGVAQISIAVDNAPSAPNITVNTPGDAVCDGQATLTANISGTVSSFIWYRSDSENGTYSVIDGQTDKTLVINRTGYYKVAAKSGDCVSEKSNIKAVAVSSGAASVTISGPQSGINPGDTRTYTATLDNPQGATYNWTVSGSANPSPASGTGSSIAVRFGTTGAATINLSASNACGTAQVTNNGYTVTVTSACTAPSITAYSPSSKTTTVFQGVISGSLSITASGSPTLFYEWYRKGSPDTKVGANSATFDIPTNLTQGSYQYYCKVTSSCNSSYATSDLFTVTVNPNPGTLTSGAGSFAGRTCFDVAQTSTGNCGDLTSRKSETLTANGSRADFTNTVTRNQTYTFTTSGVVSNVRFYYIEDGAYKNQIVESYSGGRPGNNIPSGTNVPYTIGYKSNLNTLASGKSTAEALKVTIYVVYNDNATGTGTDKQLSLTVTVKDCACCGAFTTSGNWLNFMCYNLGADQTLIMPEQQMGAATSRTYGNYYQWGKSNFGWVAGGGNTSDAAWGNGGSKGPTDPCPPGYRVPSTTQWRSIFSNSVVDGLDYVWSAGTANAWTWSGSTATHGARIGKFLFLPAIGNLIYYIGEPSATGSMAIYWSSTPSGSNNAFSLRFDNNHVHPGATFSRSTGSAVRCVVE